MTFEDIEGGPAVAGVHDLFSEVKKGNPEVDSLPDVLVEWERRPATAVSGVTSPLHGTIHRAGGPGGPTGRSGGHTARRMGGRRAGGGQHGGRGACAARGRGGHGVRPPWRGPRGSARPRAYPARP